MKDIEMILLNPGALEDAQRTMLLAAKLTQHSEDITCAEDALRIYDGDIKLDTVRKLCELPHVTLQKFASVNILVLGLSRRALAQITRHQNEVKFMAGSLQYSDHSGKQRYILPDEVKRSGADVELLEAYYKQASETYDKIKASGVSSDAAGYLLPQGFRTALLISATPYQWKHMIQQRTCRRNTPEVRYIFLKALGLLRNTAPAMFTNAEPDCTRGECHEGKFCCGEPFTYLGYELRELMTGDGTDE